MSEDPLGFSAGDTNLTRYVGNSPQNFTDPSGMSWFSEFVEDTGDFFEDVGEKIEETAEDAWDDPYVRGAIIATAAAATVFLAPQVLAAAGIGSYGAAGAGAAAAGGGTLAGGGGLAGTAGIVAPGTFGGIGGGASFGGSFVLMYGEPYVLSGLLATGTTAATTAGTTAGLGGVGGLSGLAGLFGFGAGYVSGGGQIAGISGGGSGVVVRGQSPPAAAPSHPNPQPGTIIQTGGTLSPRNQDIEEMLRYAAELQEAGDYQGAATWRKSAARMQAERQALDGRLLGPDQDVSRIANTHHPLNIAEPLKVVLDTRRELIDYTTQLKIQNSSLLYDGYRTNAYHMGGYDAVRQAQLGYDPRFVPEHIRSEVANQVDMVLMLPFEAGAVVAKPLVSGAGRLGGKLLNSGRLNPLNYRASPYGMYGGAPVPQVRFTGRGPFGRTPVVSNRIATQYGNAIQEQSAAALRIRSQIQQGGTVYKGGVLGRSETAASQFLATESPLNLGYAERYGIPPQNANFDFILGGRVHTGTSVITRSAPGIPPNPGGGIEGVINSGDFKIDWFHMP